MNYAFQNPDIRCGIVLRMTREVVRDMNWPELRDFQEWIRSMPVEVDEDGNEGLAWETADDEYKMHMENLAQNLCITVAIGGSLVISTGGFQEINNDNGLASLHWRGINAHATKTEPGRTLVLGVEDDGDFFSRLTCGQR